MQNRALCYALRNPPAGVKKTSYASIVKDKLVKKSDGTIPSVGAIWNAATTFMDEKEKRGRREGFRNTTKAEDRTVLSVFKKLRPPGHYVDARMVHSKLKRTVKNKISKRTVTRRLAEFGFVPTLKIKKTDPGPALMKRRLAFGKIHEGKDSDDWTQYLQGVADFKEFTWYPKVLRSKFNQLRARWTYMSKSERMKPDFARPKRWFKQKDYKKTQKQKVFGLTTSCGKSLCFLVPSRLTAETWAAFMKKRVVPFMKKTFPDRTTFTILFDGEKLLHAPEAKRAMREGGVSVLPNWPKYSPDLNPQENVWAWAEHAVRKLEDQDSDSMSFNDFKVHVLKGCKAYTGGGKLIPSMAKRMILLIEAKGGMIKY